MAEEKGPVQGLLDGVRENVQGIMKDFQARRVSMMAQRSDATGGLMDKVKGMRSDRKILGADGYKLGGGNILGDGGLKLGQGKILGEGGLKIGNGEIMKKIPRPLGIIKFGMPEEDEGNGKDTTPEDGEAAQEAVEQAFEATPKRVRGH